MVEEHEDVVEEEGEEEEETVDEEDAEEAEVAVSRNTPIRLGDERASWNDTRKQKSRMMRISNNGRALSSNVRCAAHSLWHVSMTMTQIYLSSCTEKYDYD